MERGEEGAGERVMFSVSITQQAEKNLKAIPKHDLPRIMDAIDALETSYFPEHHEVKKLKGFRHSYRIRVGRWRIVYTVDFESKMIFIGAILQRKHVYGKI